MPQPNNVPDNAMAPLLPLKPGDAPYIVRPDGEQFLGQLQQAFTQPAVSPMVFHGWGMGGAGKTTLTRRAEAVLGAEVSVAKVSFGLTEGIEEPLPLMAQLYRQIAPDDGGWAKDPFWDSYHQYFDTLHSLETTAAKGRGAVSDEQVGQVKQLVRLAVDVGGEFFLSESAKKTVATVADRGMDAAVAGLSLKDGLQQLLQQHRATRQDRQLQQLMLEPLPQLTQAFAAGLAHHSQQRGVLLVLDTYEKAPTAIDTWLWRTLLGNTALAECPTRLLITGRQCLLRTEGWRKLDQDRHLVAAYTVERFTEAETRSYLHQAGLMDEGEIGQIFQVTKGLPYYLHWIWQQIKQGRELNFAVGNREIVRLLLQGLNDTQQRLVQLAACCRQFDGGRIRALAERDGLDFATAVDERQNCFGWLTERSFVEPVGRDWRLDDVARDIFRESLDLEELQEIHGWLASYCKEKSEAEAPYAVPPSERYANPDWRRWRGRYFYHLLFSRRGGVDTEVLSHLLEGRYFRQDGVVQEPLRAIVGEFELAKHPLLRHRMRQFLPQIKPAIDHGWAVLEETPIDYPYNADRLGLDKQAIDRAVAVCLGKPNQFDGLAKFVALFYKAKRGPEPQQWQWLQKAQAQAETLGQMETPDCLADLFVYKLGNTLYALGRNEEAITCYDAALAIKPDKHEALNNKGVALDDLGRKEEAITCYDAALAIKPDDHEALFNKGNALSALGRKEEAITCYDAALAIKPDYHEALYNKGNALSALGRNEEAITCYDAALAIKPDDHEALNNKGNALDDLGRKEEAITCYDAALAIKPDYHEALNNKGNALSALGRKEEAITCYDAALAIKPDYHEALNNKGVALSALGRKEEAITCYDAALAIKPDYHEALYNKGVALDDLGRKEEAITCYDAALAIKPDDHEALYNKACHYALQNDADNAIQCLQSAIDLDPICQTQAQTDADFDPIRHHPQFQALVPPA